MVFRVRTANREPPSAYVESVFILWGRLSCDLVRNIPLAKQRKCRTRLYEGGGRDEEGESPRRGRVSKERRDLRVYILVSPLGVHGGIVPEFPALPGLVRSTHTRCAVQ